MDVVGGSFPQFRLGEVPNLDAEVTDPILIRKNRSCVFKARSRWPSDSISHEMKKLGAGLGSPKGKTGGQTDLRQLRGKLANAICGRNSGNARLLPHREIHSLHVTSDLAPHARLSW